MLQSIIHEMPKTALTFCGICEFVEPKRVKKPQSLKNTPHKLETKVVAVSMWQHGISAHCAAQWATKQTGREIKSSYLHTWSKQTKVIVEIKKRKASAKETA